MSALIIGGLIAMFGALIRWRLHGLASYAPGDERIYTEQARLVAEGGLEAYRKLVRDYFRYPQNWQFPSPARFGWIWLCAVVIGYGPAKPSPRSLAAIAGVAGVAVHALMMAIALELGGFVAMICAGALGLVAPLGLHLGRRALQDSLVAALTLLALLLVVDRAPAPAIVVTLFALATVKEAALLAWPALLLAAGWRGASLFPFLIAPAIYAAILCLVCGSGWRVLPAFMRAIAEGQRTDYSRRFQSGPKHRALVDLVAISPAPVLLAATGHLGSPALVWFVFLLIGAHALAPVQNVRFVAAGDAAMRILAAIALSAMDPVLPLLMLPGLIAADWMIFRRAFYASGIYDPVTHNLLRAQGAIP